MNLLQQFEADQQARLLAARARLELHNHVVAVVLVARGESGLEHRLDETRGSWDVDALLVVGSLGGMIDVLGRAGEATRLLEWVVSGVEAMQRAWGEDAQAVIRIGALLAEPMRVHRRRAGAAWTPAEIAESCTKRRPRLANCSSSCARNRPVRSPTTVASFGSDGSTVTEREIDDSFNS